MSVISFSQVSFAYPTIDVLTNVSFTCQAGERLCVVGPNGSGKTTLLNLALGRLSPLHGTIDAPTLASEDDAPATVGETLASACQHIMTLREEFDAVSHDLASSSQPALMQRFDTLLNEITAANGWELERRIDQTLHSLGLGSIAQDRPLSSLSPGQHERLKLAALLLGGQAALVLDEPTNHLDADAREFLIHTMTEWRGAVLFASHDRDFIERVATGILDLDTVPWDAIASATGREKANGIYRCAGRYSDYLREKSAARARHVQIHAQQQREKHDLTQHRASSEVVGHRHFTPRSETRVSKKFYADRAQTVSTRRIRDDSQRLEQLRESEVRRPRYESLSITLPTPRTIPAGIVCSVRNASVPGRLAPTSFELGCGQHLMLTGPNGVGKSTLLRWIHTGTAPQEASGSVNAEGCVFVPQELPDEGEAGMPCDVWREGIGELGKGFLHPRLWTIPFAQLSDGNKRRVQFALALAQRPSMLLLDEPTNYLDLDTIEALEKSLLSWEGTLILATHDQWLIDKWDQLGEGDQGRWRHIHLAPDVDG